MLLSFSLLIKVDLYCIHPIEYDGPNSVGIPKRTPGGVDREGGAIITLLIFDGYKLGYVSCIEILTIIS